MFRNPRENAFVSSSELMKPPSTGRPPTPPHPSQTTNKHSPGIKIPHDYQSSKKLNLSISGKLSNSKKIPSLKTPKKPNASILSFFKKVETPFKDDSIFFSTGNKPVHRPPSPKLTCAEVDFDESLYFLRFNEIGGSLKRRRISNRSTTSDKSDQSDAETPGSDNIDRDVHPRTIRNKENTTLQTKKNLRKAGPFFMDSDTEDENQPKLFKSSTAQTQNLSMDLLTSNITHPLNNKESNIFQDESAENDTHSNRSFKIPNRLSSHESLVISETLLPSKNSGQQVGLTESSSPTANSSPKETTRIQDEWDCFDDDGILDDDFDEGEELVGRNWIKEQAELEIDNDDSINDFTTNQCHYEHIKQVSNKIASFTCPVCNAKLFDISTDMASRHANMCLDGNIMPLPPSKGEESPDTNSIHADVKGKPLSKAAIPRSGQANPVEIETVDSKQHSAFSKIMSGKAEDTAWANAAASESSSKGKPAYQRTCPFYKIMPGFSICVDAFRYGAVQGCNAYFLSHFHSDHYIGLSSSWCHGPIFCSKITANLVKQQLRVDFKYVIPLQFDKKFEVPDTPGVSVTMISANHCPGSSLFLFEKSTGKGTFSRTQRVLHCGDFRACQAHLSHPLLMPDIVDSITGKTMQQKIDVCYLDTTYLNPRYSFPPQEQVIQACTELCLSLKNESVGEKKSQEAFKYERADTNISKYCEMSEKKAHDKKINTSFHDRRSRGRLLIVCGTYSIGKERICLGIARALDCKIYAPARKMRICAALEDEELMSRMTSDPREAQIHMQMLMEIRAETLQEYLNSFKPYFNRVVGFRPSGWTYKPPSSRATQTVTIPQILTSPSWKSSFCLSDLVPQRGSTQEASCYGVPYSEHSSFRELTIFVCALRIEKVIPTVNVGSAQGRAKMKVWIERWLAERRKNGPVSIGDGKGEIMW